MFSNNKKLYVEEMQENAMTAFTICQNKRFNVFDVEMAIITAEAYAKGIISINISFHIISIKCGKEILYRQI